MNNLSYFKIGLFVISATIIGVIGIVVLGVGTILQKKTWLETYIDESVQGLDIGSPVKFRGVPIGKVEQISLTSVEYPTRRSYVLVRIGLSGEIFQTSLAAGRALGLAAEIEKGLRVRLASQGLTGTAYIEADYLDPARNPALEIDWQPKYPYVPSSLSRITQLSDAVEKIFRGVEKIDIERLVLGLEKSLTTITNVAEGANFEKLGNQANQFLTEVRDTNQQLKALLGSPDLKSAFADGAAAAKTARKIIDEAEKPLQQLLTDLPRATESVHRLVERLDNVTADLPESSAQLRQTLRRLNRMLAGQQQEIQSTIDNIRAISENVKELTEDSKRFPAQAIFGAPPAPAGAVSR
jgi:phospholipid/cholesterol/gamma-HCH transport system substrate-binding protein/paraquat-inducible protein B